MSVGVSNDWVTVDQWRLGNLGLLAVSFRLEMPSQARPALALQLYHESAVICRSSKTDWIRILVTDESEGKEYYRKDIV